MRVIAFRKLLSFIYYFFIFFHNYNDFYDILALSYDFLLERMEMEIIMQLYDEDFLDFLSAIPDHASAIDEMIMPLSKALSQFASKIKIGKMDYKHDTQPNLFEPKGNNNYYMLYCSKYGYNHEKSVTDVFSDVSLPGNVMTFTSYASKDDAWTLEDETNIHIFHKSLFMTCSRTQLNGLVTKVATRDILTGIYTLNALARMQPQICEKHPISDYTCVFINLKNFRFINLNFGSNIGDELLRKIAHRFTYMLQEGEYVARPGGDNFVALILNERLKDFLSAIFSIRINISTPTLSQVFDIPLRAGLYAFQEGDVIPKGFSNASLALLNAKKSVRHDYVWFDEEMMLISHKNKQILDVFPHAIDAHEFEIHYQPKVDSNSMLCGCEALVRWRRNGELLPPDEFIPLLEKSSNICTLDFYVLEEVCRQIRSWIESDLTPVRVSVNFSKMHLHNRHLADDILSVMNKYHIASKYIDIELTESSAYENFDSLSEFVHNMKSHEVSTSIDDFGTGYSSLNLLKNLPVDIIKLDKSFLEDVPNCNPKDTVILRSIIHMTKELGLLTVCEGVETIEQRDFLCSLGELVIQGYLYDKPLPAKDFEKRLENKKYSI